MTELAPVSSPQFRVSLIRKLKNLVPGCTVEFVDGSSPGVRFRLKDRSGRYRSNVVHINRNGPDALSAGRLSERIWGAGKPPAGLPRGLRLRWPT